MERKYAIFASVSVFQFKQFSVNQQGCAMRINTDGVLLGAMVRSAQHGRILDIGTGTGVIALMLAQRFPNAEIDAVEIDASAALTASENAANSPYADRVQVWHGGFQDFRPASPIDLIVSNPPFFINALRNPDVRKQQARHTDRSFFLDLLAYADAHLANTGELVLIVPPELAVDVAHLGKQYGLFLIREISISSFAHSPCIRQIITLSRQVPEGVERVDFVIYANKGEYSGAYQLALQPFFLAF